MKLSSKFAWLRVRHWNRKGHRAHAKQWEEIAKRLEKQEEAERQAQVVKKDR
jgi:hypothetical protein